MTTAVTDEVMLLHHEQQILQIEIDSEPYCQHWPIGSFALICKQCKRHERLDAIGRALTRLLTGAGL